MLATFRNLLSRLRQGHPPPDTGDRSVANHPAPDQTVSLIGDLHGRDDLLERLLPRLSGQVVCLGDMIDRGEGSARAIDMLMARPEVICLKGNHEAMALEFLDDPMGKGARWLRNGGLQTLASFGVGGDISAAGLERLRDALVRAMGEDRIAWLRTRPLYWCSGNLAATHAGADPALPIERQEEKALIWGHRDFGRRPRSDGLWIAHGHVIVPEPALITDAGSKGTGGGRIALDTGAYATGRLSAAVLDEGQVRFLTA